MDSDNDISEVLPYQKPQNDTPKPTTSSPDEAPSVSGNEVSQEPVSGHQELNVHEAPLTLAFDQLNLHGEPRMAEQMFLSLGVIIQEAAEELVDIDVQEIQNVFRRADQSSKNGNRDVGVLATLETVLDQLQDSVHFVEAANILANASRDESWRLPFGQSGLLAMFLRIQARSDIEHHVLIPSLKFIGNTCADTDINRELAISPVYVPSLIQHVQNPRISRTIIPHAFRTNGLCAALVRLLEDPQFQAPELLTYVYSLLELSSSDQYDLDSCPVKSIQTVLELLQRDDLAPDDMLPIVHTAGAFLKHDHFQQHFIQHDLVYILMGVVDRSSSAYDSVTSQATVLSAAQTPDEDDLSVLRKAVSELLSDISATRAFARKYTIDSAFVESLIQWLTSQQQQKQICSCLMLGNLAQSDPVCREMVSRLGIHDRLLEILEDQTQPQVSYAALGFLRNLALPAENKPTVGTQRTVEIIARFWSENVNPQIQHASVALLRQLLNGCIGNVRWLLESLSPDPDSPAHEKTYMSLLLLLFGRTDDAATKFETGRTVATICRCISSSSQGLPPESTNAIWHRLYGLHPDIATPLAMMISQSRFPVLRSEGWFALALMARSGEGSAAVSEVFQHLETFGVLVSTITGQSPTSERPATCNTMSSDSNGSDRSPEQVQNMKDKDRENALVLVNELLRHTGDNLSDIRRSVLEDLMRGPQSPERAQQLMTRAKSEERVV
ncbi:MAG: hypothetical protein Q9226_000885 [Calogaya cf. arnoldii]